MGTQTLSAQADHATKAGSDLAEDMLAQARAIPLCTDVTKTPACLLGIATVEARKRAGKQVAEKIEACKRLYAAYFETKDRAAAQAILRSAHKAEVEACFILGLPGPRDYDCKLDVADREREWRDDDR